jgi:hypothetical protein
MARISIELPEDLKAKVEVRAAESGHRDVGTYIESLIRADADDAFEDPGAPSLIRERMEGGPSVELTPQFWKSLRPSAFPDVPKPENGRD